MTMEEFLKLDYGSVVVCERYPGEKYEIDETDVFGSGERGREYRVLGATDRATRKAIRIDQQNYKVWDVLY